MRVGLAVAAMMVFVGATAHAKSRAARPSSTAASAPKRYWIERIDINGIADEGARALFRERVWNTIELLLANDGQELVPVPEVERAIAESPDARACREPSCRIALGERLKAARILDVVIEQRSDDRSRSAWTVTWDLFALDSLEPVLHKEIACSACTDAQTLDTVIASFPSVLAEQTIVQTCRARVETTPAGADVELDGLRVGKTPFDHALAARPHELVISRPGFQTAKIALRCDVGRREALNLRLARDRSLVADEREENVAAPSVPSASRSTELTRSAPPRAPSSTKRAALIAVGSVSLVLCAASAALLGVALAYDGRGGTEGGAPYTYDTQGGMILGGVGTGVFGAIGIGLVVAGARTGVAR